MAFGLPSKEEMRDYLISKGMSPADAEARAAQTARANFRQALTTMGTQGAGAIAEGAGAAAGGNLFQRAMQAIRGLDTAGTKQLMRTSTGQMRNVAANAPTVIRTAEGQLIKLAPGQAVPAGATILNVAEAPVGQMIAGTALGTGVPAALYEQTRDRNEAATSAPPPFDAYFDPMTGYSPAGREAMPSSPARRVPIDNVEIQDGDMERAREAEIAARRPPIDEVESQDGTMGRAPPFGGEYNDVFNVPYTPPANAAAAINTARNPSPRPDYNPANGPLPVRRPDSIGQLPGSQPAQQESLLSRIFSMPKDPYEGMSSRKLFDIANKDPDNAAAFFRADKALQKEQPDMFKPKNDAVPAAAAPAQGGNFFSNLFKGGPDFQSNNQLLVQRQQGPMQPGQERAQTKLNWGDRDDAGDFFRADKARQELEKSGEAFTGMNRGGPAQAPGKDAALHKALEIIHHMLMRGH